MARPAHAILGHATTRLVYDLHRSTATRASRPLSSSTPWRARPMSPTEPGTLTKIQHSFSYSDGFGREIQKKMQAEPAGAPARCRRHDHRRR